MLSKQTIKDIQTLGQKKFRQQGRLFIAEGPKLVKELLEADASMVKEVFALKEWIVEHEKIAGKTTVTEITETELDRISQLTTPNKVLAIVRQFDEDIEIKTKGKIILALDGIQDPGNLGTIIRTADWFGINQIVCSPDSAEVYNPKVVQATMGSIARVKIFYTDLQQWLGEQKDISIYATTLDGQDVSTIKKIKEGIIIFGNESKGISADILELATIKLTIPRKGKAESLNAAVAAGVVMGYVV
ncbi:MAG TPA: RNA methyltransferase [Chitinophagaceae bacterium]|nr:RNA methyltransferase [Chitinophagaceae bacterium]